jgi:hypothetical protein
MCMQLPLADPVILVIFRCLNCFIAGLTDWVLVRDFRAGAPLVTGKKSLHEAKNR